MHFLSADQIFDGISFLEPGSILVLDTQKNVSDILAPESLEKNRVQMLEGIISPGFVNTHCHLELSHMKGRIPERTGLPGFGKHILTIRGTFKKEEVAEHQALADKEMYAAGVDACGDICNTNDSLGVKERSPVFYHSFIELLGLHPSRANDAMSAGKDLFAQFSSGGLSASLAPHAPYSTSLELIRAIADFNLEKQLPSTIHNQETEEETRFFMGAPSGFDDLYKFLQMDISWFKAPGVCSLQHYSSSLKSMQTLLVHNTFTNEKMLAAVKDENFFWCFCPNANLYIENKLPVFDLFSVVKKNICLGTDSLASNHSLSLISEANQVLASSSFTEAEVLRFMTSNGAAALKLPSHFGRISRGKSAGLLNLGIEQRKLRLIKRIS